MSLIDLDVNSWKDLLSLMIQGVVAIITIGAPPWFGYKVILEKRKIQNAEERLALKNQELKEIKQSSQLTESNIKSHQKRIEELEDCLLNIQIRVEVMLNESTDCSMANEKLSKDLIEQTPSAVINHLRVLKNQFFCQQQQLNSCYSLFQELLNFTNTKED